MKRRTKYIIATTAAISMTLLSTHRDNDVLLAENFDVELSEVESDVIQGEPVYTGPDGTPLSEMHESRLLFARGSLLKSAITERQGVKHLEYEVGWNFAGSIELTPEDEELYGDNVYRTITYTDIDGNETIISDNEPYDHHLTLDVGGKDAGIYTFQIDFYSDSGDLGLTATINAYQQEDVDISIEENDGVGDITFTDSRRLQFEYAIVWLENGEFDAEGNPRSNPVVDTGLIEPNEETGEWDYEIDISQLRKGEYYIDYVFSAEDVENSHIFDEIISRRERVYFEIEEDPAVPELKPNARVRIDYGVNPMDIEGRKRLDESVLSWEIIDSDGETVAGVESDVVHVNELAELPNGDYTVVMTETATDGNTSTAEADFERVRPNAQVSFPEENPESVSASVSRSRGSSVEWTLTGKDYNAFGDTTVVENNLLTDLAEGTYTFTLTETDVYGVTSVAEKEFTVTERGSAGIIDEEESTTPVEDESAAKRPDDMVNPDPESTVVYDSDIDGEQEVSDDADDIIVDYPVQDDVDGSESEEPDYLIDEETGEIVLDEDGNPVLNNVDELQQTGLTMILTQVGFLLLALGGGLYFWKGKKPKSEVESDETEESSVELTDDSDELPKEDVTEPEDSDTEKE